MKIKYPYTKPQSPTPFNSNSHPSHFCTKLWSKTIWGPLGLLFLSSWGMIRRAEKTIRITMKLFSGDLFVWHFNSFPMNQEKETLFLYLQCFPWRQQSISIHISPFLILHVLMPCLSPNPDIYNTVNFKSFIFVGPNFRGFMKMGIFVGT